MACNTVYHSPIPNTPKYSRKNVSRTKPLSLESSLSSSGVSFEDNISDISHFTNIAKKSPGNYFVDIIF